MRFQMTKTYSADDIKGRPYVTLTHSGVKPEGEPIVEKTKTEKEAWTAYWKVFTEFTKNAETVEWRVPPRAEQDSPDDPWFIYSRLSLTEYSNG